MAKSEVVDGSQQGRSLVGVGESARRRYAQLAGCYNVGCVIAGEFGIGPPLQYVGLMLKL